MLTKEERIQYSRHLLLNDIGEEGQLKLKNARVLVIGAGGLGCPILQYLTAAGVGTIGVIDFDVVDQSNLQRQILFTYDDIGQPKSIVAKARLERINPFIDIKAYNTRLSEHNVLDLFDAYDIIVDGSDNFSTRYLVNDACVLTDKPLVYGSIQRFEGQVTVFNYNGSGTYRCLYPTPPKPEDAPTCSEVGVLGVLPSIIGSMQANEVVKMICGIGNVSSGKLMVYNVLNNTNYALNYKKDSSIVIDKLVEDYDYFCGIIKNDEVEIRAIDEELYNFLDVRDPHERQDDDPGVNIPLFDLNEKHSGINWDKPLVVYCNSGKRSHIARSFLLEVYPDEEIYVLKQS